MGTCEFCRKSLMKPPLGRPQSKFCSAKCKEDARTAKNRTTAAEAKVDRTCASCSGVIPEEMNLRAKTCSRACGVKYQNDQRQARRTARWKATKLPCKQCGGDIPDDRHAGSKYCSTECKNRFYDAAWRAKSPGYMRQYLYGITPEQHAEMIANQDNRCAICLTDEPRGRGSWHVDHDHATGKVRGLLCHGCNIALGYFKDDVTRLQAAISYLETHAVK